MYQKNEVIQRMIKDGKEKIASALKEGDDSNFSYWDGYVSALEALDDEIFLQYERDQNFLVDDLVY